MVGCAKGFIGIVEVEEKSEGREYWDDLSGKKLDAALVEIARKDELDECRKHGVYEKVPIEECWELAGKNPIGVRWVDVNKGDGIHPEIRSRLVAKETKKGKYGFCCNHAAARSNKGIYFPRRLPRG